MSSLDRKIDGNVLVHHLKADERTIDPALLARTGRSSRALVKEGPLRIVLLALGAGGEMPAHTADGPVSIHVVEGSVRFTALGESNLLQAGDVLVYAAGVEHSAHSDGGVVFLLTVVHGEVPVVG